jgi:hypothetical protein
MRLLLTSAGIKNASIHNALVELLGKGVVDFSIFPHVDHPDLPENTMAEAERWGADLSNAAYAIDDETAIRVVDDALDVVSEGHWKFFPPTSGADNARVGQCSA